MPEPEQEQLVKDHMEWAERAARLIAHKLPYGIDPEDVIQEARIGLWDAAQSYDSTRGVPFRAWANLKMRQHIYMSVRRKHYIAATMEKLPTLMIDERNSQLVGMMAAEHEQEQASRVAGLRMQVLPAALAYLMRRIYVEGADESDLAATWRMSPRGMRSRLRRGVTLLRMAHNAAAREN